MDRYIGLDVHMESSTFGVMGPTGRKIREQVVDTDGKVLQQFVRSIGGRRHLCFEEGTHSDWLFELLEPLTVETVVVQPALHTGSEQRNDEDDAV